MGKLHSYPGLHPHYLNGFKMKRYRNPTAPGLPIWKRAWPLTSPCVSVWKCCIINYLSIYKFLNSREVDFLLLQILWRLKCTNVSKSLSTCHPFIHSISFLSQHALGQSLSNRTMQSSVLHVRGLKTCLPPLKAQYQTWILFWKILENHFFFQEYPPPCLPQKTF